MKKLIVFTVILLIAGSACFGATLTGKKMSVGLDAPLVGWLTPNIIDKDASGGIISNCGINYGLGISYRRYFNPVKTNQFNTFWAVGTVAVIIPYVGIGGDYVWDNGFYLGGGLVWLFPEIHGGYMF